MALLEAPGVKVRESVFKSFDSGSSTTTSGFVGTAQIGPTDLTRITSVNQLHSLFGVPGPTDYAIYALENTLVYADEAYFKRVIHDEGSATKAEGTSTTGIEVECIQYGSYFNGAKVKVTLDYAGLFVVSLIKGEEVLESIGLMEFDKIATVVNSSSSFINITVTGEEQAITNAATTGLEIALSGATDVNTGVTSEDVTHALQIYNNIEVVDISLLAAPGHTDLSVITAGSTIAETRGDCLFVGDCPDVSFATLTGNTYEGYRTLGSDFSSLFYPWVVAVDSVSGLNKEFPPSVFYCAQTSLAEYNYNPWYAVAGLKRGLIQKGLGVTQETTKSQRDTLYGEWGINPIIMNQGTGVVIWGNLTTKNGEDDATVSVLGSISTRKAINYVKKQLLQKSQAVLFDPNDSISRESFKLAIEPVLRKVKAERGFSDYYVDFSTTSTEDLNAGILRVAIYVKPIKAIEYVIISINATPEGVTFTEEE